MKTQGFPRRRWSAVLLNLLAMLSVATVIRGQGTVEYQFRGQVSWITAGAIVFPGAAIGSPVEGWFRVDYAVRDSGPEPYFGSYPSTRVGVGVTIGASSLTSVAGPWNGVYVSNATPPSGQDAIRLTVASGGAFGNLDLFFSDPTGQAINGDGIPGSAAEFAAFPNVSLIFPGFGAYGLSVGITQVPEPTVVVLSVVGLALLGILRCDRPPASGSDRPNTEPGAPHEPPPSSAAGLFGGSGGRRSVS